MNIKKKLKDYATTYAHISTYLTSAQGGLSLLHSLWWALHNFSDLEYLNVAGNRRISGQVSIASPSKPHTIYSDFYYTYGTV